MSDDEKDPSKQTEEATPHRLEESRKKGQIPFSREVTHFFAVLGILVVISALSPYLGREMVFALRPYLEKAGQISMEGGLLMGSLSTTVWKVFGILALPMAVFAIAGLVSGGIQTKFLVSLDLLKPKLQRISFMSGFKRLFSIKAFVDFLKGLLKLTVVGGITIAVIWPELDRLDALTSIAVSHIFEELRGLTTQLFVSIACVLLVLAGLDYMFQYFQFMKEMRMSRQEVKEEHKSLEGDPHIKGKRKQKQKELSQSRSIQQIPHATVLVTNPTHYAVALKWEENSMQAPQVIAKGVDLVAIRMRQVARENDIPIVENKPLARALYASLEIDELILPEHYKAVAEIIRYVSGIDKHYRALQEVG